MMAPEPTKTKTGLKEVKLNPPKPFTGKQRGLKQFLQDVIVYLAINKETYNNNDKKLADEPTEILPTGNAYSTYPTNYDSRRLDTDVRDHKSYGTR